MSSLIPAYGRDRVNWITDVTKVSDCKSKYICTVGEGPSLNLSKANARTNMSKIFSTKIQSKFSSTLSDAGETSSEELNESTEAVLEGVEVLKVSEDDTGYYALAGLNKSKASRSFKRQIEKMDEKMEVYLEDGGMSAARKLKQLYMQREVMNKRYEFLSGRSISESITYDQVFKSNKKLSDLVVHVYLEEEAPKEVESDLVKLLSDAGMKITTGKELNKGATHIVTGSLQADKQYMKVDGFEKYKFVLKLEAMNRDRIGSGSLNFDITETGRDYDQTHDRAIGKIRDFLNNNIDKLNIE